MSFSRSIRRFAVLPLAALSVSASALFAQGRQLFEWRGRVNSEVHISMRGRDLWTQGLPRIETPRGRTEMMSDLPRSDGRVAVRVLDGRGDVDVIQQPSSRNDYTAVIRIRDRSGGADAYRVSAFWFGRDVDDNDGRYGNGNGGSNGRDRWEDRDRRNDRWEDRNRRDDDRWSGRYGRTALRWTGSVDHELEIRMQGDRVEYRTIAGKGTRNVDADVSRRGIPRDDVELSVQLQEGRGSVYVVQQPSSWNGYTAVIRVRDPRPGFGHYEFDLTWRDRFARR